MNWLQRFIPKLSKRSASIINSHAPIHFQRSLGCSDRMPSTVNEFNSIISIALAYVARNITEPPLRVELEDGEAAPDNSPLWPLANQIDDDCAKIAISLILDGNCYGVLDEFEGMPKRVHVLLPWQMTPVFDTVDGTSIRGYQVYTGAGFGQTIFPPEQVIHWKEGLDYQRPSMGMSALKGNLRYQLADDQIAALYVGLTKNPYLKKLFVMPADSNSTMPDPADEMWDEDQRRRIADMFERMKADPTLGETIVLSEKIATSEVGVTTTDYDFSGLANLGEQRLSAALGIPAIVLGLGAGLEAATYSNFEGARRVAVENRMKPLWTTIANDATRHFHELSAQSVSWRNHFLRYDLSRVEALQENQDAVVERATKGYMTDLLKRSEARAMLGYETDAADDGYSSSLRFQSFGDPVRFAFREGRGSPEGGTMDDVG